MTLLRKFVDVFTRINAHYDEDMLFRHFFVLTWKLECY